MMIQNYPRGLRFTPFAIRIAFTADYPLDVCADLLSSAEVMPSQWRRWFGAERLEVKFSAINEDMWEFEVRRRKSKSDVNAKGYLQKVDDNITSVDGYCDANISLYLFLGIIGITWLLYGFSIFNGTKDGLLVFGAMVVIGLASVFANIFIERRRAKELVRIIETALNPTP